MKLMISQSHHWKKDLIKLAERMSKRSKQRRWTERSYFLFEKDVFFAFYSIRKLLEADKLSQDVANLSLNVVSYPALGKKVTKINNFDLTKLYDFSKGDKANLKLLLTCHQIVHSYIFTPVVNEDHSCTGIMFCSDRTRNKALYEMELEELVKCIQHVAEDDPTEWHYIRDPNLGDYKVTVV